MHIAGGAPYGVEERVLVLSTSTPLDHHDPVPALQVVAQSLGPAERALLVRPGEQFLNQVPSYPQLRLGQTAQPGQLHRQDCRAVLDRDLLLISRRTSRVHQRQHADYVGAGAGDRHQPTALADRAALSERTPQHLLTAGPGVPLVQVRAGPTRPGPPGSGSALDPDRAY